MKIPLAELTSSVGRLMRRWVEDGKLS
jgi:hypothetical protein